MLLLLTRLALASEWDERVADVTATAQIPALPEVVFNHLLDLEHLRAILPTDCVGRWEPGERTFGEGASAIVRYDMALMYRKLAMTLTKADAPRTIEFDHLGNRGFVTRWTITQVENGSEVTVLTPLNPPPKPFRKYYYTKVQPEWTECYRRTLENLAREIVR